MPYSKKDKKRVIGRDIFKLENYSRFFDLLENAISFKPIPEVSSFVNGFLLDEDNINLDSLRDEIRSYQNIHKMLVKEREKIEVLKDFMSYFNALKIAIKIDKLNNQINRNTIDIERLKTEFDDLSNEENLLRERENDVNVELYQLNHPYVSVVGK